MCQAKFVENLKIHVLCAVTFPPLHSEICAVYEIPWKNIVEQGSQQMTIQYGACPWHAGWLKQQTLRISNTYLFSTATVSYTNAPHYYVYTYIITETVRVYCAVRTEYISFTLISVCKCLTSNVCVTKFRPFGNVLSMFSFNLLRQLCVYIRIVFLVF